MEIATLLAQAPSTIPWPGWDGTILGLLFIVLFATGAGIRWFANEMLTAFRTEQKEARELFSTEQTEARVLFAKEQDAARNVFAQAIEGERSVWLDQLTKEQQRSERIIAGLAEDFKEAVGEFKQVAKGNV